MTLILGIDPGYTGALAVLDSVSGELDIIDMPVTKNPAGKKLMDYHELHDVLSFSNDLAVSAVLEHVAARPNQGAPSGFRFGESYGALQQCLACNSIPWQVITPAKWKKHFGLSADKEASIGLAKRRFPAHAKTFLKSKDGRAEAALLCLYGLEKLKL